MLGGVWLADIVNATEFRAVDVSADATFGRLVVVEGRSGGLTRRFVLAPERGWLAIRVEELRPKGGTTRLELAAAEKHGRCWVGTSARLSWLEDGSGVQTPITEVTFRVTELKVGTAVRDSLFRLPRLREGAVVLDHRSGRVYGVGARGEWLDQGVLGDTSQQGGAP